jgi:ClpP class serine protease
MTLLAAFMKIVQPWHSIFPQQRSSRRAIRQARNDRRVKAVVLRIDSPGGDGFASGFF